MLKNAHGRLAKVDTCMIEPPTLEDANVMEKQSADLSTVHVAVKWQYPSAGDRELGGELLGSRSPTELDGDSESGWSLFPAHQKTQMATRVQLLRRSKTLPSLRST